GQYAVSFTTTAIPAGGSVLVTLPSSTPFGDVAAGTLSGFGAGATMMAEPAAISDAESRNAVRGALLIRLPSGAAPGAKTVRFGLPNTPTTADKFLVQTFGEREVLQQGAFDLFMATPVVDLRITKTDGASSATPGADVT